MRLFRVYDTGIYAPRGLAATFIGGRRPPAAAALLCRNFRRARRAHPSRASLEAPGPWEAPDAAGSESRPADARLIGTSEAATLSEALAELWTGRCGRPATAGSCSNSESRWESACSPRQ